MKPARVAELLSVLEFTTICSWLDAAYGSAAKRFDVLFVERYTSGTLARIKVILANGKVLFITPETIKREVSIRKRSVKSAAANDIA